MPIIIHKSLPFLVYALNKGDVHVPCRLVVSYCPGAFAKAFNAYHIYVGTSQNAIREYFIRGVIAQTKNYASESNRQTQS